MSDRLALSQTFTLTPDERMLLLSEGIASAGTLAFFRFFINDFSTRTQGVDIVSTYAPLALRGGTTFSFAMNFTDTKVTEESTLLNPGRHPRHRARGCPGFAGTRRSTSASAEPACSAA